MGAAVSVVEFQWCNTDMYIYVYIHNTKDLRIAPHLLHNYLLIANALGKDGMLQF